VRKRFAGRWTGGMQEVPILWGFFGSSRKRFTLAFGEPITIAATGRIDRTLATATAVYRSHVGKRIGRTECQGIRKRRRARRTGLERGRRRTRQDQISPEVFGRVGHRTGEIANHLGFAPNEENLFLLPDQPLSGAGSLK
jgi:hypothetical protein